MSDKPKVDGKIPKFPVLLNASTVPPIFVELSIGEAQKLSRNIKGQVEQIVETCDPDESVGNGKTQ